MRPSILLHALLVLGLAGKPLEEARELADKGRWKEAAAVLSDHLQREAGGAEAHGLYAEVLQKLGRKDEAAHHVALGLASLEEEGEEASKESKRLRSSLSRLDPLAGRREAFFKDLARRLTEVAEKLLEAGHAERAIALLERILPVTPAAGGEREELLLLLGTARSAFEEVELDAKGAIEDLAGDRELVELESEHYVLKCNLEPEVVELVGRTMDGIFDYYVQVYFDGDLKRASGRKATIRIHPNHARMMESWEDPSRTVGGWWSSGDWTVVCYDTRTDTGTLDRMLETLFHEASHQFMTMRARGGSAPSWLNEGTATFFEGATAMADQRVLWPDAAPMRLSSLAAMLRDGKGPTVADVVGYDEPSSYPGEYYPFGWGLVYYLQQYEDPATLEYVWRPYYLRYMERACTRGGPSKANFEEIFLAPGNPGGFETFDQFAESWRSWILETTWPLHFAADRLDRRRAAIGRYVAAADAAAEGSKAPVSEEELLLRALRHAEFVRAAAGEQPDLEVLLRQVDLLERLGRAGSAAAVIELVLGLADEGRVELEPERRAELDRRMAVLDGTNYPLRVLSFRSQGLARDARLLLEKYEEREDSLLRSWSFAREAGAALEDDEHLLSAAERLRLAALAAGLVPSRILAVEGKGWATIFARELETFERAAGGITIEMPGLAAGSICTDIEVEGEYEVRARLRREGEVYTSSAYALVVSGTRDGVWIAVGIGSGDRLAVTGCYHEKGRGTAVKPIRSFDLTPPIAEDEEPLLAVRVRPGARLSIRVGERAPVEYELPFALPSKAHVGAYVKDGRMRLEDFVLEIFP